jgi:hypothetical protein
MKVTFTLSIGFSNARHEEVFDYDKNVTDDELERDWNEWCGNYIDGGYKREMD